jgi:phospholipid/cholesterol/gamma-HCH transport system ATP-binding protein
MDAIIEVHNLTVGFGSHILLQKISFQVFRGEVLALLGGSGCGKSTLMKVLIGLVPAQAGSISIAGERLDPTNPQSYGTILTHIGVMFQSGALLSSLTLAENIMLPLVERAGLSQEQAWDLARIKLHRVGLAGFERYLPEEISGGMRKRAAIARAMALDPDILFLDEPSAGLDPITSAELDALITHLNTHGTTVVLVSHELPSILAVAHRALVLHKETRSIVAQGNPQDLRDHPPHPFVAHFFHRTPWEDIP